MRTKHIQHTHLIIFMVLPAFIGAQETIQKTDLAIIGSGVAGLTAGIQAGRNNVKPLIIEGKNPGGGLVRAGTIGNWPGEIAISGPDLMEKMLTHAKKTGSQFLSAEITHADFNIHPFCLWTDQDIVVHAKSVIIATGTDRKKLACPGEETYLGKGVAVCSMCDGPLYEKKKVVIIGGGNTALYEALSLYKFTDDITIIDRQPKLTASASLMKKIKEKPSIRLLLYTNLDEILGDGAQVTGVSVTDLATQKTYQIPTDGVFIAIGMSPCSQAFKGLQCDKNGYIKVKDFTKTSVDGVFAAGNVCSRSYKQAPTAAGTGCMAAIDAEHYLKKIASRSGKIT